MRSKFFYLVAKEILEAFAKSDFKLNLLSQEIWVTPYSIVHILNRHYSPVTRQYEVDKTYHSEDVYFNNFHIVLNHIFQDLNEFHQKTTLSIDLNKIFLSYNGISYLLHTSMRGSGEKFRRLDTFYPIKGNKLKAELKNGYTPHIVKDNLVIYCPKRLKPI